MSTDSVEITAEMKNDATTNPTINSLCMSIDILLSYRQND